MPQAARPAAPLVLFVCGEWMVLDILEAVIVIRLEPGTGGMDTAQGVATGPAAGTSQALGIEEKESEPQRGGIFVARQSRRRVRPIASDVS